MRALGLRFGVRHSCPIVVGVNLDRDKQAKVFVDLCKSIDAKAWLNSDLLEYFLIPSLGLNDEFLHEQPPELSRYFGGGLGLQVWQYPNQFAEYLKFIAGFGHKVSSYMEIGTRFGGTFLIHNELLRSTSKSFRRGVAVDIMDEPPLMSAYRNCYPGSVFYWKTDTQGFSFDEHVKDEFFDLVFIDGDHSYDGVKSDASKTFKRSNIQVFHDITNDAVPGVGLFWRDFKLANSSTHDFVEFVDQYESVNGNFLGIGVSVRKHWKWKPRLLSSMTSKLRLPA